MAASNHSAQAANQDSSSRRSVRVSVAGASGYAGGELLRLLAQHPGVELVHLAAGTRAGERLDTVFPSLGNLSGEPLQRLGDRQLVATDWDQLGADSEAVFLALPHGLSLEAVPKLLDCGAKVVDLGGDFRLEDAELFEHWYGLKHTAPELLSEAAYGLPELFRNEIENARLVANPGCYPTAATLALMPVAASGMIGEAPIVVDAKSGTSGAGRQANVAFSYAELNESMTAYKVFAHRHQPEMERNLAAACARCETSTSPPRVRFAPQLVPMTRGILATCYATLRTRDEEAVLQNYRDAYAQEPFVRFLDNGSMPATKNVYGSNFAEVAVVFDPATQLLVAIAAIDNLGKGAASAAVANFNLQWGFDEATALAGSGVFP